MPTYNRKKYAKLQLDFLLKEWNGFENEIEIVVSDNGSTDGTKELLDTYKESGVKLNRNNTNLGLSANQYMCVELCVGKYIWIVGDDDTMEPGIVHHVITLIHTYTDINYIFLNHTSVLDNAKEGKMEPFYKGESGFFENALPMLMEDFCKRTNSMIFSTTSIYKMVFYKQATKLLPLTDLENYAINYFAPLAAVKNGSAFFDDKVWAYNRPQNASWHDYAYTSRRGMMRSFAKLIQVGYSKREIKDIYLSYCTRGVVEDSLVYQLMKTGNVKVFFEDYLFLFKQVPCKMLGLGIIAFFRVLKDTIIRMTKGNFKRADYNNPSDPFR